MDCSQIRHLLTSALEDVERQAAQARLVPSKESAFRNLILNQRVSAVSRFIHKAEMGSL